MYGTFWKIHVQYRDERNEFSGNEYLVVEAATLQQAVSKTTERCRRNRKTHIQVLDANKTNINQFIE